MEVDLEELAARARERVEPSWDELRERRVLAAVRRAPARKAPPRAILGRAAVALGVAAALLLAFGWWSNGGGSSARRSLLRLEDGSLCTLESGARLRASERSAELIRLVQTRGRVRYEVTHRPERTFEVVARPVTVRVRGTRFVVEVEPDEVTVTVEEGSVEVEVRSRSTELGAGDELRVARSASPAVASRSARDEARAPETTSPPAAADRIARSAAVAETAPSAGAPSEAEPPVSAAASREGAPPDATRSEAATAPRPRPPARRGRRRAARAETPRPGGPSEPASPDPAALLAQADAHRRAGRLGDASAVLEAFLRAHGDDVRAASAAFTLGRVRRQLGRHVDAAHAFARAHAEAPDGPLAEDSLAHEALSWSAAGDRARAASAAERYLDRYPVGLHASRMQLLSSP